MAQQVINIGAAPDDHTGDPLRTSFNKINLNFTELYAEIIALTASIPSGADPSASLGLAVINGAAGTFMRSDAAPALSETINPTWTGQHSWTETLRGPDGTEALPSFTFSSETNKGWYSAAASEMNLSIGGAHRLRFRLSGANPVISPPGPLTATSTNVGVQLRGGDGGATSGGGGSVTLAGGAAVSGSGGNIIATSGAGTSGGTVSFTGGARTSGNTVGATLGFTAGAAAGSGNGGVVTVTGGAGSTAGGGGSVTVSGGAPGTTGTGGTATFRGGGGGSTSGGGGGAFFNAGSATTQGNGGSASVTAGGGAGTGAGGFASLNAGSAPGSGQGGDALVASGTSASGTQGNVEFRYGSTPLARFIGSAGTFRLLLDNQELQIGAGNDLRLYHDGTNSVIRNDTGYLSTLIGGVETTRVDADATAGNTRFMLYDVDNGTLERVSVGAADSGGVGFKVLRIPN